MQIFELLRERLRDLAEGGVHVTPEGVRGAGPGLVTLDDVDRFDVEEVDGDPDHPGWGFSEGEGVRVDLADLGPYERLVLLTRSGRTLHIPTARHHDLRQVALRLNSEVAAARRARG